MPKTHQRDLANGNNLTDDEMSPLHEKIEMKPATRRHSKPWENDLYGDDSGVDEEDDWALEEQLEPNKNNWLSLVVCFIQQCVITSVSKLKQWTRGYLVPGIFLVGFLAYFVVAMLYRFGDEGSVRLLGFTILGVVIVTRHFIARNCRKAFICIYGDLQLSERHVERLKTLRFFIRWLCYGVLLSFMVWMLIDVGLKDPIKLRSMPGLLTFLLICLLFSTAPGLINWHTIFWSLGLQFVCAYLTLEFKIGRDALMWIQDRLNQYFANTKPSSTLLFGETYMDHQLVFEAMPLIFYLNATLTALYYLGAMQFCIRIIGSFLSFVLDTQPVEAMSVAGGIFMEGILAILGLKPYLSRQSKSQLFVVITSTLSSLGGAYLAILSSLGVSIHHIIPAMLISAPATFTVCKLMMPDTRPKNSKLNEIVEDDSTKGGYSNLMEAIQGGATSIIALIGNILAIAYTLLSMINWFNNTLAWFGNRVGVQGFTMEYIFSYLLYPVALAMGIEPGECKLAATLMGYRIISSNIIAFFKMKILRANRFIYDDYMLNTNFTGPISYDGSDMNLELMNTTLAGGIITERTEIILTYSLCGFSSFLSASIALGTFYTLVPQRRKWLSRLLIPALISGNVTNCMTGCFASGW